MGRRGTYPEEFRREAVALYRGSERSRAEVARSLGVSNGSLDAWVRPRSSEEPGVLALMSAPSWPGYARR
jgi:transposase